MKLFSHFSSVRGPFSIISLDTSSASRDTYPVDNSGVSVKPGGFLTAPARFLGPEQ